MTDIKNKPRGSINCNIINAPCQLPRQLRPHYFHGAIRIGTMQDQHSPQAPQTLAEVTHISNDECDQHDDGQHMSMTGLIKMFAAACAASCHNCKF